MSIFKFTTIISICIFISTLILSACKNGTEIDSIRGLSSQAKWASQTNKMPILSAGQHRDKSFWNDPSVIQDGNKYVMYMTTSVNEPWKPPVLPFRAVSDDGLNWKLDPKTPLLSAKDTPFVNNETPSVIKYKGLYHMYYTGVYPAGHVPADRRGGIPARLSALLAQ